MNKYLGTKEVLAKPMSRGEYNTYRGWQIPNNEDGSEAGYLVEYLDGGKPNDARHAGYISWSPADVFAKSYGLIETHVDRMVLEETELKKKLIGLQKFMTTDVFRALPERKQVLMDEQHRAISDYHWFLTQRIKLENGNG